MRLFHPDNAQRSARHARVFAIYELIYTAVDFLAAALFVVGSVLFFDEQTVTAGTWLFLIGSICFALRPTTHLVRELHYWRIGALERLAEPMAD